MPTQITFQQCGHIRTKTETRSKGVWSTFKRWAPMLTNKMKEEEGLCQVCDSERDFAIYEPMRIPRDGAQAQSPTRTPIANTQRRAPPPRGTTETLLLVEVRGDAEAIEYLRQVQTLAVRRTSPVREVSVAEQFQLKRAQDDLDSAVGYYNSVHQIEQHVLSVKAGPLTCSRCRQWQIVLKNPNFRTENRDFRTERDRFEENPLSKSQTHFATDLSPRPRSQLYADPSNSESPSQRSRTLLGEEYLASNPEMVAPAPRPFVDVHAWLGQQPDNVASLSQERFDQFECHELVEEELPILRRPIQDPILEDRGISALRSVTPPLGSELEGEEVILRNIRQDIEMVDREQLSDNSEDATAAFSPTADWTSRFPSFVADGPSLPRSSDFEGSQEFEIYDQEAEAPNEPSHEGELEDFLKTSRQQTMGQEPAKPTEPLLNPHSPEGSLAVNRIREYYCIPHKTPLHKTLNFPKREHFKKYLHKAYQRYPTNKKNRDTPKGKVEENIRRDGFLCLTDESLYIRREIAELAESIDWTREPFKSAFSSSEEEESSEDAFSDSSSSEAGEDENQIPEPRPTTPDQHGISEAPDSDWDAVTTESVFEENDQFASFKKAFEQHLHSYTASQDGDVETQIPEASPVVVVSPVATKVVGKVQEEVPYDGLQLEHKVITNAEFAMTTLPLVSSPLRKEILIDESFWVSSN